MNDINLLLANIGRGRPGQGAAALRRTRARSGPRTAVALCEITGTEERDAVKKLWPQPAWTHIAGPAAGGVRLLLGPGLKVVHDRITPVVPGITGYGPPRGIIEAVVHPRRHPELTQALLATHLPADFGSHHDDFIKWQRACWAALATRARAHTANGTPVTILGDVNVEARHPLPKVAHGQRILTRRGYDAVIAIAPPGMQATTTGAEEFGLGVEPQHRGHVVRDVSYRGRATAQAQKVTV